MMRLIVSVVGPMVASVVVNCKVTALYLEKVVCFSRNIRGV